MKTNEKGKIASVIALCFLIVSIVAFAVYDIDGVVDYCYIEHRLVNKQMYYRLSGHRPYRTDNVINTFTSLEEAQVAAGKMDCPLR